MKLYSDGDNLIFSCPFSEDENILYVFEDFAIRNVSLSQTNDFINVTTCFGDSFIRKMPSLMHYDLDLNIHGSTMVVDPDKTPLEILFKNTPIIDLIKLINVKVKSRD